MPSPKAEGDGAAYVYVPVAQLTYEALIRTNDADLATWVREFVATLNGRGANEFAKAVLEDTNRYKDRARKAAEARWKRQNARDDEPPPKRRMGFITQFDRAEELGDAVRGSGE